MSDTSKATPEDNLYQTLENRVVELGVEKSVNILNSYNPERDRLAQELAEVALGKGDLIWRVHVRKLATQLLKLYEEEK